MSPELMTWLVPLALLVLHTVAVHRFPWLLPYLPANTPEPSPPDPNPSPAPAPAPLAGGLLMLILKMLHLIPEAQRAAVMTELEPHLTATPK